MNPPFVACLRLACRALVAWTIVASSPAADEPPLMRPEDRIALNRQAEELAAAASEATRAVGRSVVWVRGGRERAPRLALGTVVGDGSRVLTKWSEIAAARGAIRCVTSGGSTRKATVVGVYQDDDVAVLKLEGAGLPPVRWSEAPAPGPGRFVVAALPDGHAAAIGVVSVSERSLRETDQAFLGIEQDPGYDGPGVKVGRVVRDSGAAAAGIAAGDLVLRVGDRRVDGLLELRTALNGLKPGETARLTVERGNREREVEVKLGRRPEFLQIPPHRLRMMERMAGDKGISRNGDGFPLVIQTDMQVWPELCGGPAVDLDGRVVGLVIARGTRTRSFVIPVSRVSELLGLAPIDPTVARVGRAASDPAHGRPRAGRIPRAVPLDPGAIERRRERIVEMREFMERFLREMEDLEGR